MEKNVLRIYNKIMKKIFEGSISCKAILEAKDRKCETLYVDKKKRSKDFGYIIALAKQQNVEVKLCTRDEIDQIATGKTHGGIILKAVSKQEKFLDKPVTGFICYIDGVEDPYNLGSVIRTLYASGCNALILPYRDWTMSETIILKASAGAYEKLPVYYVRNDQELIDYLKDLNMPLYCAYRNKAKAIYDVQYPENFCVAIGGALRGLSSKIINASTQNIVIEYGREFRNALDTASAAAVISFEITRQKKMGGK